MILIKDSVSLHCPCSNCSMFCFLTFVQVASPVGFHTFS